MEGEDQLLMTMYRPLTASQAYFLAQWSDEPGEITDDETSFGSWWD
jgi:hypothetical protein